MALLRKLLMKRRARREEKLFARREVEACLVEGAHGELRSAQTQDSVKPILRRVARAPARTVPIATERLHTLRDEAEAFARRMKREHGIRPTATIEELSAVVHRLSRGQELRGFHPACVQFARDRVAASAHEVGLHPGAFCRAFGSVLLHGIRA